MRYTGPMAPTVKNPSWLALVAMLREWPTEDLLRIRAAGRARMPHGSVDPGELYALTAALRARGVA